MMMRGQSNTATIRAERENNQGGVEAGKQGDCQYTLILGGREAKRQARKKHFFVSFQHTVMEIKEGWGGSKSLRYFFNSMYLVQRWIKNIDL